VSDHVTNLSDEFWDLWMELQPLTATTYGDHRFDDRLGPVERHEIEAYADRIRDVAARAAELGELGASDELTRDILVATASSTLGLLESGVYTTPIGPHLGVQSRLPMAMSRATATEPAHAEMLLERVRSIPEYLERVERAERQDLAEGLTPTATNVQRVIAQIDASIVAPVDSDPYIAIGAPADWSGEEQWRQHLRHALEEGIRPALARYREFLTDTALPLARSDDRPGLLHVPDGDRRYATVMRVFTSLELDANDVHRVGIEEVAEIQKEFASIGEQAFGLRDPGEVIHRLRQDPDLRYGSADEMLDHARRTIERAWEVVPSWFGAMPKGPCEVKPVPAALAPSLPGAYYAVGAPDGSRPGTYFLNTHEPETRTRFDAEAVAHHEAIPGHHFDRTLAAELTGIPRFRNYAADIAHAEGWGLYAERLADEMGLYSSAVDRLGMVSSDAWRAIRLVVDTGLHHLGWSRSQAIEYFTDHAPVSAESIVGEVDRYIAMPGQALAYKIGQREIVRLREKAKRAMGSRFTYPRFHDVVLTHGSVPLPVLQGLVEDWIERS
jgi:uncharacterized protein (DUF885 family)